MPRTRPTRLVQALRFFEPWALLVLLAAALLVARELRVPPGRLVLGASIGLVAFSVNEYFGHRYILHMRRPNAGWLRRWHDRLHWRHHETPSDPRWLFVPLWMALPMIAVPVGLAFVLSGALLAVPVAAGFTSGFLVYELAHFGAHLPGRPRSRWTARMKHSHMLHHYQREDRGFAVTQPLFDMLLNTWLDEPATAGKGAPAWAVVRRSLTVGGAYNLGVAFVILTMPDRLMHLLSLPATVGVYQQLLAVLLGSLGMVYLAAATTPARPPDALIALAIVARSAGGLVLVLAAASAPAFAALGVIDLGFALAHAYARLAIRLAR